jgi:hypothetical protein
VRGSESSQAEKRSGFLLLLRRRFPTRLQESGLRLTTRWSPSASRSTQEGSRSTLKGPGICDRPGQPEITQYAILGLAGRAAPPRGCFPPGRYAVANLEAVGRSRVRHQGREALAGRENICKKRDEAILKSGLDSHRSDMFPDRPPIQGANYAFPTDYIPEACSFPPSIAAVDSHQCPPTRGYSRHHSGQLWYLYTTQSLLTINN